MLYRGGGGLLNIVFPQLEITNFELSRYVSVVWEDGFQSKVSAIEESSPLSGLTYQKVTRNRGIAKSG